jgi:putative peptide zinc metalloprotease protein
MKMRPDLTFDQMTYQGVEYWVVKEPLGQKYFQFPSHVFYLLQQLDGEKSVEELLDNYHREFAPKRITRQDLQQLMTRFHQDSLVTSDLPGQGIELLKRGKKNNRMELMGQFANILAIRYKGFDPERILNFLLPYTWWIFTKACAVVVGLLATVALFSVIANWAQFQAKLPGFEAFFDPSQWYMFALVLCVTKVFHEFGHGLSCKRLGGECHEIGFMLLVLTPCLYCNVSDSWRLPNKWHRAAIGAAGMYVEIILATIATFIWWFVQPGFVQDICLKVMLVSSVSTVLFNGNPLLRFDGYYILSDILEIPNLNQKSTKALTTLLGRHWLGLEIPDDQLMPTNRPWAFAMFTVAAFCYRWFIMFSIIFFLMTMLEPYNLESLGVGIALFSMVGMLGMPGYKLYKYMSVPGRMHQVKKLRFGVTAAVVLAIVGLILFIPMPHYLRCSFIVMPSDIETVWVREPGRLDECNVKAGDEVDQGQVLAKLVNEDVDYELLSIASEIEEKIAQYEIANRRMSTTDEPLGGDPRKTLASEIASLNRRKARLEQQQQHLVLQSPITGTVLEVPYSHQGRQSQEIDEGNMQPLLSGQHENLLVGRGQRLCEVADLTNWYAVVGLSEHQVLFAKKDQDVWLKLYSDAGETMESKVERINETEYSIDREDFEPSQQEIVQGGGRAPDRLMEMVAAYQKQHLQYFARVPIENEAGPLRIGMSGQARVFTGYKSLGYRLWWWFNQNFRS